MDQVAQRLQGAARGLAFRDCDGGAGDCADREVHGEEGQQEGRVDDAGTAQGVEQPLAEAGLPAGDHHQREVGEAPGQQRRAGGEQAAQEAAVVADREGPAEAAAREAEGEERPEEHRLGRSALRVQPGAGAERSERARHDCSEQVHGAYLAFVT